MAGMGRLSTLASRERYRSKNKERLAIIRTLNYYKQKVKESEKKLKELEQKKEMEEKE